MFENFGNRLRKLRTAKGLTQAELGRRINLSAAEIEKYESGEKLPALGIMEDLTVQLEVPLDELFDCESCSRISTVGLTDEKKELISRLVGYFKE